MRFEIDNLIPKKPTTSQLADAKYTSMSAQRDKQAADAAIAQEQARQAELARQKALAVAPVPTITAQPQSQASYVAISGDAKSFIYMHESGGRTNAINASSGACGLGQALPCSKLPCTLSDYACQDAWFTNYMLSRYGSWENARSFWLSHSWW